MKPKYVDERFPPWLVFPPALVTSSRDDWVVRLSSLEDAERLVTEHHVVHDMLTECAMAFAEAAPEAFTDFWYGPSDGTCTRCDSAPRGKNGLCATCTDEDAERYENSPVQDQLRSGPLPGDPVFEIAADQLDAYGEALRDVVAALTAAISLLERSPKKAAPSDRVFDQMLADYRRSLERGRAVLRPR